MPFIHRIAATFAALPQIARGTIVGAGLSNVSISIVSLAEYGLRRIEPSKISSSVQNNFPPCFRIRMNASREL